MPTKSTTIFYIYVASNPARALALDKGDLTPWTVIAEYKVRETPTLYIPDVQPRPELPAYCIKVVPRRLEKTLAYLDVPLVHKTREAANRASIEIMDRIREREQKKANAALQAVREIDRQIIRLIETY